MVNLTWERYEGGPYHRPSHSTMRSIKCRFGNYAIVISHQGANSYQLFLDHHNTDLEEPLRIGIDYTGILIGAMNAAEYILYQIDSVNKLTVSPFNAERLTQTLEQLYSSEEPFDHT